MDSMTPELSNEPVRLVQSQGTQDEERVLLFTMERPLRDPDPDTGRMVEVQEFTIPKRQRPAVGLRFIYETKILGEQVATANLLSNAMGEEAFLTLCTHDELTVEQFERIQRIVLKYTMGDVEVGKARRGTGS